MRGQNREVKRSLYNDDHLAFGVGDHRELVVLFADARRHRRAEQHRVHFVAGVAQRALDDVDRDAVDPSKIRTIYKSQTFPTTGFGHAHNLDPTLSAKVRQAFFTFDWEGSALKKEFEKPNKLLENLRLSLSALIRKKTG